MKYEKPEVAVKTFALSAIQTVGGKAENNSEDSQPNKHLDISCYEDNE